MGRLENNRIVGAQVLEVPKAGAFFGVEYPLPADLTRGAEAITVTLQVEPGATAGGIFDLRVLRTDP